MIKNINKEWKKKKKKKKYKIIYDFKLEIIY